jgi:hypothetical protein
MGNKSSVVMLTLAAMTGCATASPVMDAGDGVYLISARAAPVRGGATGAYTVAYEDAQKFCAQKGNGLHAIVVNNQDRDIYQSSFGGGFSGTPSGGYSGGIGGGTFAAGSTMRVLLALVGVLVSASDLWAWCATGHEWVSGIAIEKLPDSVPAFVRTPEAAAEIAVHRDRDVSRSREEPGGRRNYP